MICTSIQNKTLSEISAILDSGAVEMAEIRIDLCPSLTYTDIEALFSRTDVTLLATCRIGGSVTEQEAEHKLCKAVEAGASFVDLEIEAPESIATTIGKTAAQYGARFVRSIHFYDGTPDSSVLDKTVKSCLSGGADTVKIVTYAHSHADAERVMALYDRYKSMVPSGRLCAFCMGAAGKLSRFEALRRGAPFTYAALSEEERTADGQWTAEEMRGALYGGGSLWRGGVAQVPASKSMAQRAVIAATLACGTSHLAGYSPCADSESAIRFARTLGAEITQEGSTLIVKGIGANPRIPQEVFTGESGFLTRISIPIISMLQSGSTTVNGEGTLVGRPLLCAQETMEAFGVTLSKSSVPLRIEGKLHAGKAVITGKGGSQLISGLMASLPLADSPSEITIEEPTSVPYLHLTANVLREFGIDIKLESSCGKLIIKIAGGQSYKPATINLEGDWSGAAPLLIAGAVYGSVSVPDLSLSSTQADLAVVKVLESAGAKVTVRHGVASTAKSPLHGFKCNLNQSPDLFPVVAVLAAMSEGESRLDGVGRLASKESDRAKAIIGMFDGLGVESRIESDTLIVNGMGLSRRFATGNLLKGGSFTSHHDHRMVMALMLASLGADSKIMIDDVECVAKSFPGFHLVNC